MSEPSVEERYTPDGTCFGCGPANLHGLRLRSFPGEDGLVATWHPQPHHQAVLGVLNGGVIGTLLDCHSAMTAWWAFGQRDGEPGPSPLTAEYAIKLLSPTPMDEPVRLEARVVALEERRASVEASLSAGGAVRATATATFVRPRRGT